MTARHDRLAVRIALVTDTYAPQVNGVTTVCRRIVRTVREAGHGAAVVAPAYPGGNGDDTTSELRVPSLPFPLYPAIRLSLPLRGRVFDFLDRFQPELVHVAVEGPLGVLGRAYALRRGLPLVTSYHTDFPAYASHYGAGALTPVVWGWLRRFHAPARLTQTPGEQVRDELMRHGLRRAVVWGRGVDAGHFHPDRRDAGWRQRLGGSENRVIVLHVGRLAREKNLDVLAAAWSRAHQRLGAQVAFVVAGEGPLEQRLAAELPFAQRLGFLDRDALAALYASADLCVLPSPTETCGLVALEAMASGLPVLAADAGGLRETVRHGENGLLAPARDPQAFADAIGALVANAAWRRALGAAARRTAEARDVLGENRELLVQYARVIEAARVEAACAA